MLRQRCLRCDAVLDADGNCVFCNPPRPGSLKPRPIRSAKRMQNLVGNACLVAALLLLLSVAAPRAAQSMVDVLMRPIKWLADFSLDGPQGAKNPLREGVDQ